VEITGKLTQIHRSILDVMQSSYSAVELSDGAIAILFSQYDLLKRLGKQDGGSDRKWLEDKLEELRTARLTIRVNHGQAEYGITTGILREYRWVAAGETKRFGVVLSPEYARMIESDIGVRYSQDELAILLSLSAQAQAVARFALSHKSLNMSLGDILAALGLTQETVSPRVYRRHVAAVTKDRARLLDLGIVLDGHSKGAIVRRVRTTADPLSRQRGPLIPVSRTPYPGNSDLLSRQSQDL
jgi:hypothetical protein